MHPSLISALYAFPSAPSSDLHSSMMLLTLSISLTDVTMGMRILTSRPFDARSIARICILKCSMSERLARSPLNPRAGLSSRTPSPEETSSLSPPASSVLMTTGFPRKESAIREYTSACSSSVGILLSFMKRNSVRTSPAPSDTELTPGTFSNPILHITSMVMPSIVTLGA